MPTQARRLIDAGDIDASTAGDRGPWVSLPLRATIPEGTARRRPDPDPTLSIFPDQVHIGDRFTDAETGDEPHEWEVVSRPVTFKKGHEVRARVQRPGDPGTAREKYWAAHEKITVRRGTAAVNRAPAELDDITDVEALRRELRRLRADVQRLEEEKQDLERRLAVMQRELEQTRAKVPRGVSTS